MCGALVPGQSLILFSLYGVTQREVITGHRLREKKGGGKDCNLKLISFTILLFQSDARPSPDAKSMPIRHLARLIRRQRRFDIRYFLSETEVEEAGIKF